MRTETTYGIACAVINKEGKILILKRAPDKTLFPDKWFVVGAYPLKAGDDMEKIARRELMDELGVAGNIIKEGGWFTKNQGKITIKVKPFLAMLEFDDIRLNKEHTEYKWIGKEMLKDFDLVSGTEKMITNLLKK